MIGDPVSMLKGYSAGLLFTAAWFIFVDAALVVTPSLSHPVLIQGEFWAPGIVSSIGLLLVCLALPSEISADEFTYYNATCVMVKARLFLVVGVLSLLGGFAGALAVDIINYVQVGKGGLETYPGIAVIIQCALIIISAVLMRFCPRRRDDYESF